MKKMKLKIPKQPIYESCLIESKKLRLLGCEALCSSYIANLGFNPCFSCDCNNFSCNFSSDDVFYYKLEHYKKDTVLHSEIGLGNLVLNNSEYYLERIQTILSKDINGDVVFSGNFYKTNPSSDDEYLQLTNYTPTDFRQYLLSPYSIIISDKDSYSLPLSIDNYSLIGREKEEITSISIQSICNTALEYISSFKKSIHLSAYKLYCKILNCDSIVLSKKPLEKKAPMGTISWDSSDNKLKFYNGKEWLNIQTGGSNIENT